MSVVGDFIAEQVGLTSAWSLINLEDGKDTTVKGQFEAENLTENLGARYAKINSLNRQSPIIQFLGGQLETVTFNATFFARDSISTGKGEIDKQIEQLKTWNKRDSQLGRPPILEFTAAGEHPVGYANCVIETLGGISYMSPTRGGRLKGATLSITLLRYEPYDLEGFVGGETRYHNAKFGEYYEMLTYVEYGSALFGDVIRKRHPGKYNLQTAEIVKLPSFEVIRKEKVETKSIPLKTAYGRKDTPQRSLRLYMFEKRNRPYVSHL